jgi:hypothetical protein
MRLVDPVEPGSRCAPDDFSLLTLGGIRRYFRDCRPV